MRTQMISALVVLLGLAGSAALAEPTSSPIIQPVLGHLVGLTLPQGFVAQKEQEGLDRYFRAAALKGETATNWSQLISLTAVKNTENDPKQTAQFIAANIADSIRKLCPDTFAVKPLGPTKINGHDGFVAVTSCGKVEPDKHSETALTVVIKPADAIYTIQWTERAPSNAENLTIDEAKWKARLQQMTPFRICPIVTGEKPPYPSCTKK